MLKPASASAPKARRVACRSSSREAYSRPNPLPEASRSTVRSPLENPQQENAREKIRSAMGSSSGCAPSGRLNAATTMCSSPRISIPALRRDSAAADGSGRAYSSKSIVAVTIRSASAPPWGRVRLARRFSILSWIFRSSSVSSAMLMGLRR